MIIPEYGRCPICDSVPVMIVRTRRGGMCAACAKAREDMAIIDEEKARLRGVCLAQNIKKTMENSMGTMEICTRCDTLTNLDISNHYREGSWWFSKKDFTAAFAHWVVKQSPYDAPDITKALVAWNNHLASLFPNSDMAVVLSYDALDSLISEEVFEDIPEIEKLNHRKNEEKTGFGPDDDFTGLGALARNIFYMVIREKITQS